MGRVGRKAARIQVSSRLTWTFSARAGLGRSRSAGLAPSRAAATAQRAASVALLRSLLRAVRGSQPRHTPAHALRTRRFRHR
ncbi:hypothetical protein [Streptomyces anandii]|uniref:hypothetical protein n=1 Tax=Streptomyces anandii TaxID=285454 RepID=UPI0037A9BE3A